jgi:hypothetical protein
LNPELVIEKLGNSETETSVVEWSDQKSFRCKKCQKIFKYQFTLERHRAKDCCQTPTSGQTDNWQNRFLDQTVIEDSKEMVIFPEINFKMEIEEEAENSNDSGRNK